MSMSDALDQLDPAAREAFLKVAKHQVFPAGKILFEQEDRHRASYLILSGLVRIYYIGPSGREATLAYWEDGDLVGGPDLFGQLDHVWSGATRKETEVLSITGSELKILAQSHPSILWWVTSTLARKLRWLSLLFQLHGTERVPQRLSRLLLMLADTYGIAVGEGVLIRHWVNQGDLANLLGASRQWTNRALRQFEKQGLVSFRDRQIVIIDEASLRHVGAPSERRKFAGGD